MAMTGTWTLAELTPATPEHVSRAYRTALTNLVVAPSDLAVAILHAQGALETGHFKSCWCNNAGNIKAGEKWAGKYTAIKLNEVLNGQTVWFAPEGELESKYGAIKGKLWPVPEGHPQTRMRAYETLAGGVEDKIRFLASPYWRPALDLALEGNAGGYVESIRARNYFTAALDPYRRAVISLAQKYLPVAVSTREQEASPKIEDDSDELCRDMAACMRFDLPDWLAARVTVHQAEHVDFALDVVRADRDKEITGE